MEESNELIFRRYLIDVDYDPEGMYINHDFMGEKYIAEHSHEKVQFLYTEGGVVHVKTENTNYFLPARHYMLIAPGVKHCVFPSSEKVIMRNVYFPVLDSNPEFYRETAIYPVNDFLLHFLMYTNKWNGPVPASSEKDYSILKAFACLLPDLSQHRLFFSLPVTSNERLNKVLKYLEDNVGNQVLFDDLAANFGFSSRSLSRLFQKELKMSFVQYFILFRMLRALHLIAEKKLTISEIAYAVGYSSLPTFSNTFAKIIGVRPTEYAAAKGIFSDK